MAKTKEEKFQTHVYLNADDVAKLKTVADAESRSFTMQIQHFIRIGLDSYSGRAEFKDGR